MQRANGFSHRTCHYACRNIGTCRWIGIGAFLISPQPIEPSSISLWWLECFLSGHAAHHRAGNRSSSNFKLEGKLTGPWVQELEQSWSALSEESRRTLIVNLSDVSYIDSSGKALLARMYQKGATLQAFSPMNQSIVDEIVRAGKHALVLLVVVFALVSGVSAQDSAPLRLTLQDAVQLALKQNPQVQIAKLNVAESQQDRKIARAGLLPQASLQAYEQTRRFPVAPLFGLQPAAGTSLSGSPRSLPGLPGRAQLFGARVRSDTLAALAGVQRRRRRHSGAKHGRARADRDPGGLAVPGQPARRPPT